MLLLVKNGKVQSMGSTNQYNGDKTGGEFNDWSTFSTDPNEFVKTSYKELSKRNITLYHTFAAARAVVNKPISYIIGEGLKFKSAINNKLVGWEEAKAVEWSARFSQMLHFLKEDINYYEKQSILFRQGSITGDSILYFLREDDGRPFDLIVSGGYDIDEDVDTIGIRTDKYNRPIGFTKKDGTFIKFKEDDGSLNAILFMLQETAGQLRGQGCFYSEIARAKQFDRVLDATVARMVMESLLLGYFANDEMNGASQIKAQAAAAKAAKSGGSVDKETLESVGSAAKLKPGNMLQFNNQGSMRFTDLKTPSKNFGDANEYYMLLFSMARGYPKAFITGQYDASYSAGRSVLNDAMKKVYQERSVFIRNVDNVVNLEMLKWLASTGQIEVPPAFWTNKMVQQSMIQGVHIGPTPSAINPLQEVNADSKAVAEGFTTRENIARKWGNDWDSTIDDWAKQNRQHTKGLTNEDNTP